MTDGGSVSLAEASNAAIYATTVTLTIAMVLFAASFASGRRRTTSSSSAAGRETAEGSVAVSRYLRSHTSSRYARAEGSRP